MNVMKKTTIPDEITTIYGNDPKFLHRQVWANSVDPDLIRVYTVCHSVCIYWMHYSVVRLPCSSFRVVTANFLYVRIFRNFTMLYNFFLDYRTVRGRNVEWPETSRSSHSCRGQLYVEKYRHGRQVGLCHVNPVMLRFLSHKRDFGEQYRPRPIFCIL